MFLKKRMECMENGHKHDQYPSLIIARGNNTHEAGCKQRSIGS